MSAMLGETEGGMVPKGGLKSSLPFTAFTQQFSKY